MLDEVYVKSALLYHGGTLFGRAVNFPDKLATTILTFMIKFTFGGPEFVAKMLPVTKLNADFQYLHCQTIIENILQQQGEVLAVIVDGNRVNQSFFRKFPTVLGKPWLVYLNYMYKK